MRHGEVGRARYKRLPKKLEATPLALTPDEEALLDDWDSPADMYR